MQAVTVKLHDGTGGADSWHAADRRAGCQLGVLKWNRRTRSTSSAYLSRRTTDALRPIITAVRAQVEAAVRDQLRPGPSAWRP